MQEKSVVLVWRRRRYAGTIQRTGRDGRPWERSSEDQPKQKDSHDETDESRQPGEPDKAVAQQEGEPGSEPKGVVRGEEDGGEKLSRMVWDKLARMLTREKNRSSRDRQGTTRVS